MLVPAAAQPLFVGCMRIMAKQFQTGGNLNRKVFVEA